MPSTSELSSSSTETIVPIQSNEIHLLTLVHGMWGTPSHVGRLSEVIAETYSKGLEYGAELNVLIAEANKDNHTYDGVDWCAERVVEEIQERIRLLEFDPSSPRKVTRFSIMGYSLGGLVSRYAIGILHSQKFFERVTPVNFTTIATPHIGLVRYPTWIGSIKTMLGPIFLSRTGQHFFATDKWSDEQPKPLLEVMSEKDGIFYQGLCEFRNVTLYANIINDLTVPFVTSAIETCDPFINYHVNGIEIELDEAYFPLVKSHSFPFAPPPPPQKPQLFSKEWFEKAAEAPVFVPPLLVMKFPLNIPIYLSIPFLLPPVLTALVAAFTIHVLCSRRRIKLLESSGRSSRNTLVELFRTVEKGVEDVVVDIMDAEGPIDDPSCAPLKPQLKGKEKQEKKLYPVSLPPWSDQFDKPEDQPVLTEAQHRMIANLNSVPHLKKHFVFLDNVRNSHGVIICREVNDYAFHGRGEGVLRHYADNFQL